MSDDTRNGTTHVPTPAAGDAAQLLAAVKGLLPPAAAEELAAWSRGERSATAAAERLRGLANGPAAPPRADWNPAEREELDRQLRELEKHSPPFDPAAQRADCGWIGERQVAGDLESYRGKNVAVLNGRIVGAAEDELRLKIDLAREHGVHPDQITMVYIFPAGFWWGIR